MMTGTMVGIIVGSLVSEAWTYEYSFYISSVIALLTGIFTLLILREPYKRRRRDCYYNSRKLENRGFKVFLRRNPVILLILAIISMMGLSLIRSFLPIFAFQQLGVSAVYVGITLAIFNGASVVMAPLFGRISYKIGEKSLIVSGLCLYSLMMLSYAFVKDIHQIVLVTFGAAVSFSLVNPSLLALLTRSVTLYPHGAVMGVYGACEDLGVMIAPVIYGICWSTYGPASIFYVYPIIATVGVILSIMLREKGGSDHR